MRERAGETIGDSWRFGIAAAAAATTTAASLDGYTPDILSHNGRSGSH